MLGHVIVVNIREHSCVSMSIVISHKSQVTSQSQESVSKLQAYHLTALPDHVLGRGPNSDAQCSSSQSTVGSSSSSASSQDMQSFGDYIALASTPVHSYTLLTEAEHAAHVEDAEHKAQETDEALVEAKFAQ